MNTLPPQRSRWQKGTDMELMFNEVMRGLNAIIDTNEHTARAAVGMLIDMVCARYGGDPVEFAEQVADCVRIVNDNMGEYEEVAL